MSHRCEREDRSRHKLPVASVVPDVLDRSRRKKTWHSDQPASGTLPTIHEQYDTAITQWRRINDELQLDKGGLDLARRLMLENGGQR
jgi:hypothetical protein